MSIEYSVKPIRGTVTITIGLNPKSPRCLDCQFCMDRPENRGGKRCILTQTPLFDTGTISYNCPVEWQEGEPNEL